MTRRRMLPHPAAKARRMRLAAWLVGTQRARVPAGSAIDERTRKVMDDAPSGYLGGLCQKMFRLGNIDAMGWGGGEDDMPF